MQIEGLPGPAAAGRADGLHRQPRGLHRARQDHHAAQGSHRLGDPHALRREPAAGDGDHRRRKRGSIGRTPRAPLEVPVWVREVDRGSGVPGARGSAHRQALRRQPAPAHHRDRERREQRRAAGAGRAATRRRWRASRTSTRRCRRSPASSSWSTRASCAAPTRSARELIRVGGRQRVPGQLATPGHRAHRRLVRRRRHPADGGHD